MISSEHGIATHYIPSSRIPDLKARLSSLENATPDLVDAAIEELYFERSEDEAPPPLTGKTRSALDMAFSRQTAEDIVTALTGLTEEKDETGKWAAMTLDEINARSPTSLKVALGAVRRGKSMTFGEALQMEMCLATAFIVCLPQPFSQKRYLFQRRMEQARISPQELLQCLWTK
jgi:3-hydroxyisobutyryl-CoA hydrolase